LVKTIIFDYYVGNLLSIKFAIERVGLGVFIDTSEQNLAETDVILFPSEVVL